MAREFDVDGTEPKVVIDGETFAVVLNYDPRKYSGRYRLERLAEDHPGVVAILPKAISKTGKELPGLQSLCVRVDHRVVSEGLSVTVVPVF